jgi:hypothetical protein
VYPQPAHDEQGAVFNVQHGAHNRVWVNTLFDLKNGRMRYVALIPGALVSVIDAADGRSKTTRIDVS